MVIEAPSAPWPAPAPGPRRRHPAARALGLIVGWGCAVLAALGLLARTLDTPFQPLIVLASGAWVFAPLSLVALGLHLWRRARVAAAVAVALVVVQGFVYGPLFVGTTAPPGGTAIEVLTQNMLYGQADPTAIVDRVKAAGVDVFVAQELTTDAVAKLRAAGLDDVLPYAELDARPEAAGTGLWSRFPISGQRRLVPKGIVGIVARVAVPGGARFTAVTVHPSAPFPKNPADWYADLDKVRNVLLALPPGPVLVGGDFNSTDDNARFRRLLVDGWRDGAEQAGAGLIRSWPSNQIIPPVVGIDHVLTRDAVATSVQTVDTPGSDHRGLLATVVVPR